MRKPSIEDRIRDRLKGHSERIDNDKLFDSLGISESKERKKLLFWWFGGIAMFLLVLVGIFVFNDMEYTENANSQQYETINAHDEDDAIAENITIESKEDFGANPKIKYASITYQENKTQEIQTPTSSQKHIMDMGDELNRDKMSSAIVEGSILDITAKAKEDKIIYNASTIAQNDTRILPEKEEFTQESVNDQSIGTIKDFYLDNRELGYELPELKPTVHKRHKAFSIMLYGGVSPFEQNFAVKDKFSSEFQRYALERDNSEHELEHLHLGLQFRYKLNKNWYIGTGVQYSRYNSKYVFKETTYTSKNDEGIANIGISILGDTSYIDRGVVQVESQVNSTYTYYNALSQWEVPVSLWYTIPYKRIEFIAGLQCNSAISTNYKGVLINDNGQRNAGGNFYRDRSLLFSVEPSIGMSYRLSAQNSIHLSAFYRHNVSSFTNENHPLEHTISSAGMRLGYQFNF